MRDFPVFGQNLFTQTAMRQYLQPSDYEAFCEAIARRAPLPAKLADAVAEGMLQWACDRGATHFSHWFQPLTGVTAEKHDAFIQPLGDGSAALALSGKMLTHGEPDASSFPSGGLRATFEARGLTTWDYTSPVFLKEDTSGVTLCIPTSFCSYHGQSLDEKTPLLRSMEAVEQSALRLLSALGISDTVSVVPMVGAEQEYFLVDAALFHKRMDMVFTGRTLFGARPTKSQEMEGHYFGTIKERIAGYMRELDTELWKMGVAAKTRHNESAPAQHELAPVFDRCHIAADHNQLMMETMQRVAGHHGLRCVLHGKPFAYSNGSGKHNNWSLVAGSRNLFVPEDSPQGGKLFLAMIAALLWAVDRHSGLLRSAASSLDNDLRLGACEAPPAILSVYLGTSLTDTFEELTEHLSLPSLPKILSGQSDRNRTSPFAFTGNRFELRILPASVSIAWSNTILNTIMAEALDKLADSVENAPDPWDALLKKTAELYSASRRIVYNGNGYGEQWEAEAARRGLKHLRDTVEALPEMFTEETISLFETYHVLSREELEARAAVRWETYARDAFLEASVMLEMVDKQILPACMCYQGKLAAQAAHIRACSADVSCQEEYVRQLGLLLSNVRESFLALKAVMEEGKKFPQDQPQNRACYHRDALLPVVRTLRTHCDALERIVPDTDWPFPTYNELLFNI